ncbi:MAG TPA: ABC transporter permease [Micromonosporaceae bacterium]|nr:ABC transporter permease [Micromonosporaceae bacterium]
MNLTIARITARGLFGRRRFLLLLPLPVLLVGLALLSSWLGARPDEWTPPVVIGLGFGVVLPVMALIVGTGVLGSEIDDGTVVHILAKPLPRREIVFAKLAVAVLVTALTVGVPLFLAGLVTGLPRFAVGLVAGALVGAVAYTALFLALSLVTRRPVLVGLVYVLVWEDLLSNLLSGTRVLSIQQYVIAVADKVAPTDLLQGNVSLGVSLVMASIITVAGTVLAIDRLRSFSVAGETS